MKHFSEGSFTQWSLSTVFCQISRSITTLFSTKIHCQCFVAMLHLLQMSSRQNKIQFLFYISSLTKRRIRQSSFQTTKIILYMDSSFLLTDNSIYIDKVIQYRKNLSWIFERSLQREYGQRTSVLPELFFRENLCGRIIFFIVGCEIGRPPHPARVHVRCSSENIGRYFYERYRTKGYGRVCECGKFYYIDFNGQLRHEGAMTLDFTAIS